MWEIGVDIVEVQRFIDHNYTNHNNFYKRTFTQQEISYCLKFEHSAQHFAAIFAGKEAVYKAVNKKIDIKFNQIEIIRIDGFPEVKLLTKENGSLDKNQSQIVVKITLSHTQRYAVAFVLAEFKKQN